jgi:AcrR family transcriptional regulator
MRFDTGGRLRLSLTPTGTYARILDAAIKLFDEQGIRGTTVDEIAKEAGVTKRTVYYHFRSKDDLLARALTDQGTTERRAIDLVFKESRDELESNIMRLFGEIARYAADPRWKGCAFIRASVELAGMPGHPAVHAARNHRKYVERTLCRELTEIHAVEPESLARRLAILLDGAITYSVVHHDPKYAVEAGRLAVSLVAAARRTGRFGMEQMEATTPCVLSSHASKHLGRTANS